eukprot:81091-Rhodomonas_salina.1
MSVAHRNHTELVQTAQIDAHSGTVTALALDLLRMVTASPPACLTLGSSDQPSQCALWVATCLCHCVGMMIIRAAAQGLQSLGAKLPLTESSLKCSWCSSWSKNLFRVKVEKVDSDLQVSVTT